jgi:hypothetical protein
MRTGRNARGRRHQTAPLKAAEGWAQGPGGGGDSPPPPVPNRTAPGPATGAPAVITDMSRLVTLGSIAAAYEPVTCPAGLPAGRPM